MSFGVKQKVMRATTDREGDDVVGTLPPVNLMTALESFRVERGDTLAASTFGNYLSAFRSLAAFGIVTTGDLTRERFLEWLASRRETGVLAATINTSLMAVFGLLNHLERQGRFPDDLLRALRRLKLKEPRKREPIFLTRPQAAALIVQARGIDDRLALAVQLAMFAGLRLNELRKLDRADLAIDGPDVERPYIRVTRARGETKTRRTRTVPIARAFAEELRSVLLEVEGPLFPAINASQSKDGCMHRGTLKGWLREARDRAGLPFVSWHVLRHTYASWCRTSGLEIGRIAGWMGHSVRTCETYYAAMAPGGDPAVERGFAPDPRLDGDLPAPTTAPTKPDRKVAILNLPRRAQGGA